LGEQLSSIPERLAQASLQLAAAMVLLLMKPRTVVRTDLCNGPVLGWVKCFARPLHSS
jgi:hypothetical protein